MVLRRACGSDIIHRLDFVTFFSQFELSLFQASILSTCVDSMYLVRVTPPINFTFSDDFRFLKKTWRGHKFSEFACLLILWGA